MRFIRFNGHGGNEIVSLEEGPDPVPEPGQILVAARYAGVNPADVLQRNGGYPVPPDAPQDIPGLEVSGEVVAVGSRVRRWEVGDRVIGIVGGGGLADRVLAQDQHVWRSPAALGPAQAAALPEAVLTAFDALRRARVGLGDVVVVRGVNGGVGIAACHLVRELGGRAIGIGRSEAALQQVAALGITVALAAGAAEVVASLGNASAIIDLVGGEGVAEDLSLLRPGGRIVVVSTAGGLTAQVPLNLLMGKRADLMGTVLRGRSNAEKALLVGDLEHRLSAVLGDRVSIPVDRVYQAEEATAAFDRLGEPGKFGKVLLDFGA
ncbi:alcohol dehydrogenase catalytic domain-containing protein [Amycolatopsis panacis]|uniref:Enoyl reductase (ER) domain-containing protein n=1 Tax=Amycolatopsis panacis TaxID=2340917 RepID=A0A419I4P0_9PSEU|nr:zinc-binding dehydrogenase [Amycolatopsis panacis]RJQ85456.1 hypothetical protein D5S19_13795 [Amycolatopsis panacis]